MKKGSLHFYSLLPSYVFDVAGEKIVWKLLLFLFTLDKVKKIMECDDGVE